MPFVSALPARLLQAAAFPDTIIARTIPERGMLEWTSGVLQIVVLLLGIGLLIATILLILSLRAGVRRFNETVDRLASETKPLLANATAIVGDAREVVAMLRTDVERVTHAAEALSEQLLDAADRTARRVDDVNAVLDVLQDELEDTALSAVSAIRGVRVGASELRAELSHPRPRGAPTPVDDNDDA
jgi:methyl-accepting chemotaxis protein